MPALHTHYKFGQDVLNKLNKQLQTNIKSNVSYYNMFNQGFDNLYYYLINWKYYRTFGIQAHKHNIDLFFENIFNYIKDNKLENNSEITNIIYGFINHYTLDTLLHPYINYQVKNLNIPHTKIEFMLDSKLTDNNSSKFYKTLIPKIKFPNKLIELLNEVFEKTYKEKNIGKIFNKSHNLGYYIYRYFINDKYGIKTFLYKIIDFIIPKKDIKFSKNTFYSKQFDERLLNSKKNIWNHPNNKEETYNYSFNELYNLAIEVCTKLNNDAYEVLNNRKDLEELINNIKSINLKSIQELL
ncbi:MAG: hypothetical protein IJN13_02410 [Bacilli bacterium]|nr:hypothetical protein [Bacilli bacterium]